MKRVISALCVFAAIITLSGCSGISQEKYDLLVSENSKLSIENESLKSDYKILDGELNDVKAQNEILQSEKKQLQDKISDNEKSDKIKSDCLEIAERMLGRPQDTLVHNTVDIQEVYASSETSIYDDNSCITSKVVDTLDSYLSIMPEQTAVYIYSTYDSFSKSFTNLLSKGVTQNNIIIFRYSNGEVIASMFSYINSDDQTIHNDLIWSESSQSVKEEFEKIQLNQ